MGIGEYIWNEAFWFSDETKDEGIGWRSFIEDSFLSTYSSLNMLTCSFIIAFVLTLLRTLLRRTILLSLGISFGVPREQRVRVSDCPVLETTYKRRCKLDKFTLEKLSKQSDMTTRQIEIWFRKRVRLDKITNLQRFTESCWHMVIRGTTFVSGLLLLWNKPWFWETKYAWLDWPRQHVSDDIYFFYVLQLTIYFHFTCNLLLDHKKKDFWRMVLHHICTFILIYFSWSLNLFRIGSLIMLVHDASDPWVHLGKMLVYSKKSLASDIVFAIFVFVWLSTKTVIYPFVLLYSTTFEAPKYLPVTMYVIVFFNLFLYILMALHLIWTYNIFEIIINKIRHGELRDVRSDAEDDSED